MVPNLGPDVLRDLQCCYTIWALQVTLFLQGGGVFVQVGDKVVATSFLYLFPAYFSLTKLEPSICPHNSTIPKILFNILKQYVLKINTFLQKQASIHFNVLYIMVILQDIK